MRLLANAAPPPQFLIQWVVLPVLALLAAVIVAWLLFRRYRRKR